MRSPGAASLLSVDSDSVRSSAPGSVAIARLRVAAVAQLAVGVVLDHPEAVVRASAAIASRRSRGSVRPVGFWNVGIV